MNEVNTVPGAAVDAKADAIRNLRDFHQTAKRVRLPYVLIDGTLLGAFRDGDFCEGDEDDIDIGVLSEDYELVETLELHLKKRGFQVDDHFYFGDRLEGVKLKRGASHFDVVRISHHPTEPECYSVGRVVRKTPRGNIMDAIAFVYPEHHHFGFDTIEFYGMNFRIPADPEGFLSVRYGDWRTPVTRASGFNWYEQGHRSIRDSYPPIL